MPLIFGGQRCNNPFGARHVIIDRVCELAKTKTTAAAVVAMAAPLAPPWHWRQAPAGRQQQQQQQQGSKCSS